MTRAEERTIRQHVRQITAELLGRALDAGVYHTELEKLIGHPLRLGTTEAFASAQACADELAAMRNRTERAR